MQSWLLSLDGVVNNQQLKRSGGILHSLMTKWYWSMCLLICLHELLAAFQPYLSEHIRCYITIVLAYTFVLGVNKFLCQSCTFVCTYLHGMFFSSSYFGLPFGSRYILQKSCMQIGPLLSFVRQHDLSSKFSHLNEAYSRSNLSFVMDLM